MSKVEMPKFLREYTAKEAYTVPMFRFVGQETSFQIIDNLKNQTVMLHPKCVKSLIKQLQDYSDAIDKLELETKNGN